MLKQKHLLGLEGYPAEDIQTIIDTAFNFREVLERPIKKVPSLQGVTIVNLFLKTQRVLELVLNLLRNVSVLILLTFRLLLVV